MGHHASKFHTGNLSSPSKHPMMLGTGAQGNFMLKKQNAENRQLKSVIASLCEKLKDYQKQFISNKSALAEEQA